MTKSQGTTESGMTLIELMVSMVVAAVILGALVTLFIGQSRLFGEQESQRTAREAVRSAVHVLTSDLRRIEASGGVEAASAESITIRTPFAMGLVCSSSAANTTVSLLPPDSASYANAEISGFAWRAGGTYSYVPATTLDAGTASLCTGALITTLAGGRVVRISPGAGAGVPAGTPAMLYERVRYDFRGGASGFTLVRTIITPGAEEALVESFDGAGTRFRYFAGADDEAEDDPPSDLSDIRGVELVLEGLGDRPRAGSNTIATAPVTATVFFRNRPE